MDGDKKIFGLNIRKAPTKEELFKLEKKLFTGNGELRDLLPLAGIGDGPIDYENRANLFWAEIEFLNDEIERLGGKKREYIMTKKQKKEAGKFEKEMKKFEEKNKEKLLASVAQLVER